MGLDMYLSAKKYLSKYANDQRDLDRLAQIKEMFPELLTAEGKEASIEVEFGAVYWRKANHIHKWFVDNVQDGVDDCRSYYVSQENLRTLLETCKAVLADRSKADELLPTASGFFFGGTEYDEWYFQDVEDTVKAMEECLALGDDVDFSYRSSW